ncbi:hypothetical protein SDC9_173171 [bioreactor metagenome]|uniref:Uncharacterized protein n=1 Tax=bioreactor metagenome TaxID=1076179 RepID=A0A645GHU1_9ZZZZ
MKIPSTLSFSTTLVSPVTIITPASSEVFLIEATISFKASNEKPSSIIKLKLIYFGIEKEVTRSFTVPEMQSLPISPPGKNSGFTTKESVVKAILSVSTFKTAASLSLSRLSLENSL